MSLFIDNQLVILISKFNIKHFTPINKILYTNSIYLKYVISLGKNILILMASCFRLLDHHF